MKVLFFVIDFLKRFMRHIHELFKRKKIKITVTDQDYKRRKVVIELRNQSKDEFFATLQEFAKCKTLEAQKKFNNEHGLEIQFIEDAKDETDTSNKELVKGGDSADESKPNSK